MKKMRILLADDHAVTRAGLRLLLERQPNIEVVGEAENGRELIEQGTVKPEIVKGRLTINWFAWAQL